MVMCYTAPMGSYGWIIILFIVVRYVLDTVADRLNLAHWQEQVPETFRDVCDAGRYRQSQRYLRDSTRLDSLRDSVMTGATLVFLLVGGFSWVDTLARRPGWTMVPTGLLFFGLLLLAVKVLQEPFDIYDTFRLEARYGFNRMTPRTYVLDEIKGLALTALLGAPLLALILWLFARLGPWAWLPAWVVTTLLQLLLVYLAPTLILPLFNRFTPLAAGEVRDLIEDYARRQAFPLDGIYTMDGSRRSTKANAFFTGLGRRRRIVLYDTLLKEHSPSEVLAIVAHEMGHFKLGHIPRRLLRGLAGSALMYALLAVFITRPGLYAAFDLPPDALYAGLVVFTLLYSPLARLIGLVEHAISRRQEYEADAYAVKTADAGEPLSRALKRLAVRQLANLTPHPLTVWLHYSHPPMVDRLAALETSTGSASPARGEPA